MGWREFWTKRRRARRRGDPVPPSFENGPVVKTFGVDGSYHPHGVPGQTADSRLGLPDDFGWRAGKRTR